MGSSPQRMKADNKRAGKKGSLPKDQQFVQLINSFRQEPAYRALSYGARCLYTELRAAYNKFNNGKIMCSGGHAANLIGCAKSSAVKYLGELNLHGFIVETRRGSIGTDGHGQGTLWRLTELGCPGVNNGMPTKDYRNWRPGKNKTPYRNSVQGIPKIGAPTPPSIPKFGAGHTENRCGKAANKPSGIPKSGHICRYQGEGDAARTSTNGDFVGEPRKFTVTIGARADGGDQS